MQRLFALAQRLRQDECGGLLAAEYLLMGTLLTIGLFVGISSVQEALLEQLNCLKLLILGTKP